ALLLVVPGGARVGNGKRIVRVSDARELEAIVRPLPVVQVVVAADDVAPPGARLPHHPLRVVSPLPRPQVLGVSQGQTLYGVDHGPQGALSQPAVTEHAVHSGRLVKT